MNFYAILADSKVIDVNTVFLRWLASRGVMIICAPEQAEFICPRDGSAIYHPGWLNKPPDGAVYDGDVDAEEITEAEYKELLARLEAGEAVDKPDPDPGETGGEEPGGDTGDSGGHTVADMKQLVETCAGLQKQVQMLTDCLLEMSEEVYA